MEFRRVRFRAAFLQDKEALVYSAGSALRPDVSGPGYWAFTPARAPDGAVLIVNRGFVPADRRDVQTRMAGQVAGELDLVGVLRWPEARSWLTPADSPEKNLWFTRDLAGMAKAKGVERVAPFYVELEEAVPPGGLPRAGRLTLNLPNNHLQYAITWYGLAAGLAGVFLVWFRGRRASQPIRG
jgi:surfeit locus 1 family protein